MGCFVLQAVVVTSVLFNFFLFYLVQMEGITVLIIFVPLKSIIFTLCLEVLLF